MPLSTPHPRELLHRRSIECTGYRREDGLFDIEGHLTDVKSYSFPNRYRGQIRAGEPVHDMWVRLTLDEHLLIHAICGDINDAYAALSGIRIGAGWRRQVQERVGGVRGCVHITELLWPMATTAFQTVHGRRAERRPEPGEHTGGKPFFVDSCHALASDGPVIRDELPQWFTGEQGFTGEQAPAAREEPEKNR